ncbi:hypothetical protein U9M48_043971 [Paspalum notatum var. saurae]|uniref:Uncharacterized protein n=1 Tax=Paspalum notatum var. saurae TaxID=547442 RepID=A0AAQ3UY10_PASNO
MGVHKDAPSGWCQSGAWDSSTYGTMYTLVKRTLVIIRAAGSRCCLDCNPNLVSTANTAHLWDTPSTLHIRRARPTLLVKMLTVSSIFFSEVAIESGYRQIIRAMLSQGDESAKLALQRGWLHLGERFEDVHELGGPRLDAEAPDDVNDLVDAVRVLQDDAGLERDEHDNLIPRQAEDIAGEREPTEECGLRVVAEDEGKRANAAITRVSEPPRTLRRVVKNEAKRIGFGETSHARRGAETPIDLVVKHDALLERLHQVGD